MRAKEGLPTAVAWFRCVDAEAGRTSSGGVARYMMRVSSNKPLQLRHRLQSVAAVFIAGLPVENVPCHNIPLARS